jgi:NADH:ubiquinone oxidoreductase subunit D
MGLLNNKVLKTRLRSVGGISKIKSYNYGLTGIIARSSGIKKDLRLNKGVIYGAY